MPVNGRSWGFNVSEGGLEPPFGWYTTESVVYHQSKLTQQGPVRIGIPQTGSGAAAGPHE
jgi:hypothetical protein